MNPNTDVISASVDELRSAVGVLELPPPPSVVSFFLNCLFKSVIIYFIKIFNYRFLTKQSKFRPKSALNDRIVSGTQTLRLKASSRIVNTLCIYKKKTKKTYTHYSY